MVEERLAGIVDRVTFVCSRTGWSVFRVAPFDAPQTHVTVTLHQVSVFAGATMEFRGNWKTHPRYGEQFECSSAVERKPASAAALERYLGSGLIRGVGPKTARKIVRHFGGDTLRVFEDDMERLLEVRGIATRKLEKIASSWQEHRAIRNVMLFLQEHGVSTLFAVRIYKRYGNKAVALVREDPYRLARDIFGIGFFSADGIALSLGFALDGRPRLEAGIRHVLSASREAGHCYLLREQVLDRGAALLQPDNKYEPPDAAPTAAMDPAVLSESLAAILDGLVEQRQVVIRDLKGAQDETQTRAYYAPALHRAEQQVAERVAKLLKNSMQVDLTRVETWLDAHARQSAIRLSEEQRAAVRGIVAQSFSILTGGPGCGKTTTLRTLVALTRAMGRRVTLAAPTGRAAQRMAEVIGLEAKTLHRLLEWEPSSGGFKRGAQYPLATDLLVVDETSMLDVLIAAALLDAVPPGAAVVFIGDPHQLPSVGPGAVLADLLATTAVPRYELNTVFRQAQRSDIIRFAHAINRGDIPQPRSPVAHPDLWSSGTDCMFLDSEIATQAELTFLRRAKRAVAQTIEHDQPTPVVSEGRWVGELRPELQTPRASVRLVRAQRVDAAPTPKPASTSTPNPESMPEFSVPQRFRYVDIEALSKTSSGLQELQTVLRRVHPHSTLHHGITLIEAITRLYQRTIPMHFGAGTEIQILTPMNRGTVGATALNDAVQTVVNPKSPQRGQIELGPRVLRVGDRVIQRRNNYDLGVFNGDIGTITELDAVALTVSVTFTSATAEDRTVGYARDALGELALAYAITIHKSQGSEFPVVIIPIVSQHFTMLFRDLVYTGLTRARKLAVFVGSRHALGLAVANIDPRLRQTALAAVLNDLQSCPTRG